MIINKLHIYLAEDDQDDRLFFKEVFTTLKMDYELIMCEDGLKLLESLKTAAILPHIIFLDLSMPGKDGLECLTEIKKDSRLKDITVAIYSSSAASRQDEMFLAGANVYIKKQNDIENLRKILSEVIYINWQYITDGMDKESFMLNY